MRASSGSAGDGFATASIVTGVRILATGVAFWIAWLLRFSSGWIPVEGRVDVLPARYLEGLPVAALAVLVSFRAVGLSFSSVSRARPSSLRQCIAAAILASLLLATVALFAREHFQYSRYFLILLGMMLSIILPIMEWPAATISDAWRRRFAPVARILLVGDSDSARRFTDALFSAGDPSVVIGRTGPTASGSENSSLGTVEETPEVATREHADQVMLLDGVIRLPGTDALLGRLADGTAEVAFAWTLPRPHGFPEPGLRSLGDFAVAYYWESRLRGIRATSKRVFDTVISAILLILLSPVYLFLALLVRCTSGGPVFHGQTRVGLDGRTFTMWKFRTMVLGAEDASGPVFATPDDPRRTPAGAFLRRFSLDELPQIWNVFRGDMSLVGPRPERPEFVEGFRKTIPGYMLRHSLKSGVTGLAQVHGLRGRSSIEERLAYDLEYARRWSFLLDVEILLRTVAQVIAGRNAY